MKLTRRVLTFLLATLFWWALTPCVHAQAEPAYTVDIPPLPNGLSALLSTVSDCVNLQNTPPETPGLLRRRMNNDRDAFIEALKSRGYFTAKIEAALDTSLAPPAISFHIMPGPQFTFDSPVLQLLPPDSRVLALLAVPLERIKAGAGYSSSLVLDTETAIVELLRENGYPSPVATGRKVVADHAKQRVFVRFEIQTGPKAVFGSTQISGLETVSRDYVTRLLTWTHGADFDIRKVDETRAELIKTGLFRSVRIDTDHPGGTDAVTMRLELLEGAHRSLSSGLWYYSDQGLGAGAGWTHRNLLGGGEEYQINMKISENIQEASSALILPGTGHPDQTLNLLAKYGNEITDGYETTNLSLSGVMRRTFSALSLGYGLAYRVTTVEKESTRQFNLFSIPLIAEWTNVDHPLEPTRGLALAGRMEPYADVENRRSSFVLWNLTGRHYLPLFQDKSLILATRGRYSVLAGTGRDGIPEDLLLYAGGGGSVRGYAYQYAGELDENEEPLGGVSAVDFSAELRWRINKDFGAVLFCDGGAAFSGRDPGDPRDLFWGVGGGLRYYTPIGPIRLDVATPLDRRSGVDDPIQLYVSLGQAF